jgi:hypothetical protein
VQLVLTVDFLLQQLKALMMILGLHQPQHHLLAAGQPPLAMNLRFKPTYPSIPSRSIHLKARALEKEHHNGSKK